MSGVRRIRTDCGAALLAAGLLCACATSDGPRPAALEIQGREGFTVTERVSAGGGVRGDYQRALRLFEEGRRDEAIAGLVEVTEAAPHLTTAHIDLGMAYARVEDFERAEASLTRALELTPRHPVAHNELGIVMRKTGRFPQARASYERALEIYPEFHFARRNLAILCDLYLEDLECALEHYGLYHQAVPDDASVAMWISDLRNRLGNQAGSQEGM